jgi:hypothetical protein
MKPIVVALAVVVMALPSAASAEPSAVAAKTCTRDVPAVIGGQHKCLGAGEYCATRYEREYVRYGFECVGSPPRLRHHH